MPAKKQKEAASEKAAAIAETMPTWHHTQTIYEDRRSEVVHRYGRRIADRMRAQVHRIPTILARYATFPVLSALK
jgi:hypothetical protein